MYVWFIDFLHPTDSSPLKFPLTYSTNSIPSPLGHLYLKMYKTNLFLTTAILPFPQSFPFMGPRNSILHKTQCVLDPHFPPPSLCSIQHWDNFITRVIKSRVWKTCTFANLLLKFKHCFDFFLLRTSFALSISHKVTVSLFKQY